MQQMGCIIVMKVIARINLDYRPLYSVFVLAVTIWQAAGQIAYRLSNRSKQKFAVAAWRMTLNIYTFIRQMTAMKKT